MFFSHGLKWLLPKTKVVSKCSDMGNNRPTSNFTGPLKRKITGDDKMKAFFKFLMKNGSFLPLTGHFLGRGPNIWIVAMWGLMSELLGTTFVLGENPLLTLKKDKFLKKSYDIRRPKILCNMKWRHIYIFVCVCVCVRIIT